MRTTELHGHLNDANFSYQSSRGYGSRSSNYAVNYQGVQIGTVTRNRYLHIDEATLGGVEIQLQFTTRAGDAEVARRLGEFSEFRWVQVQSDDSTDISSMRRSADAANESLPDRADPFYYSDAAAASLRAGSDISFADRPTRSKDDVNAARPLIWWQGELALVGVRAGGEIQVLRVLRYGFEIELQADGSKRCKLATLCGSGGPSNEFSHTLAQSLEGFSRSAVQPGQPMPVSQGIDRDPEQATFGRASAALAPANYGAAQRSAWPPVMHAHPMSFSGQVLQAYLQHIDSQGTIEDNLNSDDKAREVVGLWTQGHASYLLPVRRKILLIQEMIAGFTGDEDEGQILQLLRGATDAELTEIIGRIGVDGFNADLHGAEQDQFNQLMSTRNVGQVSLADDLVNPETFDAETILTLQRRFEQNANATNRLNCILIIRQLAPQLFGADPAVARDVQRVLNGLSGPDIKMTRFGQELTTLNLVSQAREITFQNGNGANEPTALSSSAWDAIVGMVGNVQGWHVFGLAPFNGYHSVTVLVEKRADRPLVYWADQWRIDPGDDFHQSSGSVSGFRRYERAGFDRFIAEKTNEWWNDVFTQRGARWNASCHIWKLRSRLPPVIRGRGTSFNRSYGAYRPRRPEPARAIGGEQIPAVAPTRGTSRTLGNPATLPGRSFGYLWHSLSLNFQVLAPTPIGTELMLAIFWEETLFNNVFQRPGTAVGFGQTEPFEFYRFNANNLNSPNPNMRRMAEHAQAKGYLVYGLPPVISLGPNRARIDIPLSDDNAVRVACAMVRDLHERGRSKRGILNGYGGVGFQGQQPAHLATPGGREAIINGWLACEQALQNIQPPMDPDRVMQALQLSRPFPNTVEYRRLLFPDEDVFPTP